MKKIFFIPVLILFSLLFAPFSLAGTSGDYISYTDVGQGTPLVLIHAYPFDQRLWQPQVNTLKQHFRVITLDLWGFGHSAPTKKNLVTMNDYADEVKQLLDQLHIKKAIIGGESMGGYVTLAFLQQYPDKVAGLLLADTNSITDTPEAKANRYKIANDMETNGTQQFIKTFLPKAVSENATPETRDYLLTIMNEQTAKGMAAAIRGIGERNNTSLSLSKVTVPVLIITGDKDQVVSPQQSYDMHDLVKGSRLVVIPESGHLSNIEKPEQWNQAVIETFSQ